MIIMDTARSSYVETCLTVYFQGFLFNSLLTNFACSARVKATWKIYRYLIFSFRNIKTRKVLSRNLGKVTLSELSGFYNYKKIMLNVVFHSFLSWSCGGVEDVVVLILWSQLIITYLPWYLLKIFIFSKYQALVFVIILLSVRPFILFRLVIWVSLANLGIFSWMLKWNGLAPDYM